MAFTIGTTPVTALYLGTTRITKAYLGTTLLFDETYITTQTDSPLTTQDATLLLVQSSTPIAV